MSSVVMLWALGFEASVVQRRRSAQVLGFKALDLGLSGQDYSDLKEWGWADKRQHVCGF